MEAEISIEVKKINLAKADGIQVMVNPDLKIGAIVKLSYTDNLLKLLYP